MSTTNGAKPSRKARRTVIAVAVIAAIAAVTPFAVHSTQTSQRDLDHSLQRLQQTRR